MSIAGIISRRPAGLLALALLAFIGWAGLSVVAPSGAAERGPPEFETITSRQLAAMLEDKDLLLVNVHFPYEGEIAETDAFIPFDQIAEQLDRFPADKSAPIVLYCRSGRMSEIAAGELAARGYSNVSHLGGGMIEWEKAGQEILRK